jgi:hypothetical protein
MRSYSFRNTGDFSSLVHTTSEVIGCKIIQSIDKIEELNQNRHNIDPSRTRSELQRAHPNKSFAIETTSIRISKKNTLKSISYSSFGCVRSLLPVGYSSVGQVRDELVHGVA